MTKIHFNAFIVTLIGFLVIFQPAFSDKNFAADFASHIDANGFSIKTNSTIYKEDLKRFYKNRNYKPVWYDSNGKELVKIEDLYKDIRTSAHNNGLSYKNYDLVALSQKYASDPMNREWILSNTVMNYMYVLMNGQVDPSEYDSMIFMPERNQYLDVHLTNFFKDWSHSRYLQKIEPQQEDYQALKEALAEYRQIAEDGGWPQISNTNLVLYPGDHHEIIAEIRERLKNEDYDGILPENSWVDEGRIDGETLRHLVKNAPEPNETFDLDMNVNPAHVYDAQLARQIAEFQYLNGKKTDGIIGPQTLRALNTPVESQIKKIILSMERWRWLPENLGNKYVLVNIAGFYTQAVENDQVEFMMPIIVGEVAHQTPVFGSVITDVKFHPDWVAPRSIARRYLIEKIQTNPSLISTLGYQIQHVSGNNVETIPWENVSLRQLDDLDLSQYRFRQRPGKYNALGRARFSIENNYAIFMHGTPSGELFNADARTFSSGCIRVKDPLKLAKFLLRDNTDYNEEAIEALYNISDDHPRTTFRRLKEKVPVYLTYSTAWTDRSGNLHFSDDIYGRDEKLEAIFSPTI